MWLAMTQPSCKYDLCFTGLIHDEPAGAPAESSFACRSCDVADFMESVLFSWTQLYPWGLIVTMIWINSDQSSQYLLASSVRMGST